MEGCMTRVVCYIRQSDEEGHKKDLSCPSQERRFLMDIAARQTMGEELEHEIAPWDQGKSGGEIDRPGIQWVLANLDRFDEVWVYDHDRLAREAYYGPYIMKELRSRGIRLWVSTGGSDEDTPMGRFMTDLRLRFGALYREQVAEKTKENRDHRLREGYWSGHPPTGYKYVFENREGSRRILVPDPEKAEMISRLFRLLAAGHSQKSAARQMGLNETTILWQRDNPLYIGLVYKIRKNIDLLPDRSYAALWALALDSGCGFLYPGKHEPLVDSETWDKMQLRHARENRGQRLSERRALSGQLRCVKCGSAVRMRRPKGERSPSIRCDACRWERSYAYAEHTIFAALALLARSPKFEKEVEAELRARDQYSESNRRLADLARTRAELATKLDHALDAMLESAELSPALKAKATEYQRAMVELDQEIAREKASMEGRTRVSEWRSARQYLLDLDIVDIWRESTVAEQRELLNGVFSKILAGPNGLALHVRGLDLGLEMSWHRGGVSPLMEVAGPGIEPGTP